MTLLETVKRLEELEKAATASRWEHVHIYDGEEVIRADLDRWDAPSIGWFEHRGDGALVEALRNVAPALLDALRKAEEWLEMTDAPVASASANSEMWHYIQAQKAREAFRDALRGET